jgi:hypothetical protein
MKSAGENSMDVVRNIIILFLLCTCSAVTYAGESLPERLHLPPIRLAPVESQINEFSLSALERLAAASSAVEVQIPRSWRLVSSMPILDSHGGQSFVLIFQDMSTSSVHALSINKDGFVSGGHGFTIRAY